MQVEAFDLEVQVVVDPQSYNSFGAHGPGICRVHDGPVDLEAHFGRVLLGIDFQAICGTALSISLLDGGALGPALADLAGVRPLTTFDQILSVIPNQEIDVMLVSSCQILSAKKETVAFGVL